MKSRKKPRYKTLSSRTILKNKFVHFKHEKFLLPDGTKGNYYYHRVKGGVNVIPVLDSKKIILIKQERYLFPGKIFLEFPGGKVESNQSFSIAAAKELSEETGYKAKKIVYAGEFAPYQGETNEITKVYVAKGLKHVGQSLENTEDIEVLTFTPSQIESMIRRNKIFDGQTIAAWALAKDKIKGIK